MAVIFLPLLTTSSTKNMGNCSVTCWSNINRPTLDKFHCLENLKWINKTTWKGVQQIWVEYFVLGDLTEVLFFLSDVQDSSSFETTLNAGQINFTLLCSFQLSLEESCSSKTTASRFCVSVLTHVFITSANFSVFSEWRGQLQGVYHLLPAVSSNAIGQAAE